MTGTDPNRRRDDGQAAVTEADPTAVPGLTRLAAWRHPAPELADTPGVRLGAVTVGRGVHDLFDVGVRRVALADVVDLSDAGEPGAALRALATVRDLTSHGIVVDWAVRLPGGVEEEDRQGGVDEAVWGAGGWRRLGHLHPPTRVHARRDGEVIAAEWAESFFLCRCVYRHGPGFVQVRDRRLGSLSRFTVDDPEYQAAIGALAPGAPAARVPAHVLADYRAEGLVWTVGELSLWLPYRVRRWPSPAFAV